MYKLILLVMVIGGFVFAGSWNNVTQLDNTAINGEATVTDNVTQTVTFHDSESHIKAVSQ